MKLGKKLLSTVTAGLVLSASLAGCSSMGAKSIPLPAGVPEDVIMEAAGIARDTPLLQVDGVDVPAEELLYWVAASADQYAAYGMSDLTMDMGEGQTLGQYYLDNAVETATLYRVVLNHAEELKLGWSEENQANYDTMLQQLKDSLAVQSGLSLATDEASPDPELQAKVDAEYMRFLASIGLSDDGFFHINQVSFLVENITQGLFGTEGSDAPDADKIEAAGVLRAKHILIKAVASEDGTDDGMAAALEQSTGLYNQIVAAGDPAALFDELRVAQSQDTDTYGNVNDGTEGYTFGPSEMVAPFEEGTAALAVGEISQPIQSDFGYHIILRLDTDNEAGQAKYAQIKLNEILEQWMEEAVTEKAEALGDLDPAAYYTKLTEVRQAITDAAEGESTPTETGTPAPTPTPAG